MSRRGPVHWEEGLFLQPHHLQVMLRDGAVDRAFDRRILQPFPYGVVQMALSRDELTNLVLRLERLVAVMPSGTVVEYPGTAEIPPLEIAKVYQGSTQSFMVSLGVPRWYPDRGNTVDGPDASWRVRRMYRVDEIERVDENTGENPQPVRVRRVNARLLLEGDDETDLEVLPLVRVAHGVGEDEGLPRLDPAFVPPCLTIEGSTALYNRLRDLANAVSSSRRELVVQMTRGGFSIETLRGLQFEQMLRLRTLSRAAPRIAQLVECGHVTPFAINLELRSLLGELSALHPDRPLPEVPPYDHNDPGPIFAQLDGRIRDFLRGAVAPSFVKVEFTLGADHHEVELTPEHFERATDWFLGVRSAQDAVALARIVEDGDRFKLMPKSLTGRAVRGLKLAEERHPPLQLPSDPALHYFRIVHTESARAWSLVERERELTAQWPDAGASDYQLTIYLPVSAEGVS